MISPDTAFPFASAAPFAAAAACAGTSYLLLRRRTTGQQVERQRALDHEARRNTWINTVFRPRRLMKRIGYMPTEATVAVATPAPQSAARRPIKVNLLTFSEGLHSYRRREPASVKGAVAPILPAAPPPLAVDP